MANLKKTKHIFLSGVVQKPTSQASPAGSADPEWSAEQGCQQAVEKEKLSGQRGQLRERSQRAVHAAREHLTPSCKQQQHRGAGVYLEPGVHFPALRPAVYLLLLLHAALLSHGIHPGAGLQPGLHGLLVLLHRDGLRLLPFAHAPPAIRRGLRHEPHGQQRGVQSPEPRVFPLLVGVRGSGVGLQRSCRLPGL